MKQQVKQELIVGDKKFLCINLYAIPGVLSGVGSFRGKNRNIISPCIKANYDEIKDLFADNITWGIETTTKEEDGTEHNDYVDYSSYCYVCFKGDFMNGTTFIVMGEKLPSEKALEDCADKDLIIKALTEGTDNE